ncbi:MAG TPA: hypothetical protein VIK91_15010 [Nannocystis sp.]
MHDRRLPPLVLSSFLLLGACDGDGLGGSFQYLPPITAAESLVWVDPERDEVVFVVPGDGADLDVRRTLVGDDRTRIAWGQATRDGKSVLLLTVPASPKEEDIDEQLHRIPADGDGEPVRYDVQAPFTAVALSPDHRRAILYFGQDGGSEQLHNANQIAIVDLAGKRVANVTLNGFGGTLRSVEFPAQRIEGQPAAVRIGGKDRDIAAFLADSEVVLMDMGDPALDQVAIPLGTDINFAPATTLLRPGNDRFADPVLFVRSAYGSEVGMLTLIPEAGGDGFTAQISLVDVGQASDFVYYDSDEVPYLLTVDPGRGELAFTDIRTQGGFRVAFATAVQHVFLRDAVSENALTRQAVVWAPGGTQIGTLDLGRIEDSLGRKPRHLKIETGINDLVRLDNDRVLIGSGNTLYVVDFPAEQVTPLSSKVVYDPQGSALVGNRLLLGTAGQQWVSTVDLKTLGPESMLLDDPIQSFHYLPGPDRIVVTHADPVGHLTVVDPADPSRATSHVHWGFLLAGLLERN